MGEVAYQPLLAALEAVGQIGKTRADIPRRVQIFKLLSENLI